jgi:FkbM family methyltransferase
MLRLARVALAGSRWEEPVKRAYYGLTRDKSKLYDSQTIAVMRRVLRRDSNAVDAGAFEGGMLRHMLRLAPRGRHLAFEPLPDRYEALVRRFPAAQVHPYALDAEPGTATFFCALRHPALSGLRPRRERLGSEPVREVRVVKETLDRVVPPDLPIAFMKVDVEGAELGLLRGGIRTLRRTRPVIVFEFGIGGADHFGAGPGDLFDLLAVEIGLEISLLGDWLAGRGSLSRPAFIAQYEERLNYYFVAHPAPGSWRVGQARAMISAT